MNVRHTLVRLAVLWAVGVSLTCSAQIIRDNIVNTPEELSFTFTGTAFAIKDFAPFFPTGQGFDAVSEIIGTRQTGFYGVEILHKTGGQTAQLGPYFTDFVNQPLSFGTTMTSSLSLPHGAGMDEYFLELTVQEPPAGTDFDWGAFSGSFRAVHTAGTSVPDGGSTLALLGTVLGLLPFARRMRS